MSGLTFILNQGILIEGEDSVLIASSLWYLGLQSITKVQTSWAKLYRTWGCIHKILFSSLLTNRNNKPQCLSLEVLSSLFQCLWVRPRAYPYRGAPTRDKHSSLLYPFLSYEESRVLWKWHKETDGTLSFLSVRIPWQYFFMQNCNYFNKELFLSWGFLIFNSLLHTKW